MASEFKERLKEAKEIQAFRLPEGYFMHLSEAIQTKVERKPSLLENLWSSLPLRWVYTGMAMGLCVIGGYYFYAKPTDASVSQASIEEYISTEMNEQDLSALVLAQQNPVEAEENALENASELDLLENL